MKSLYLSALLMLAAVVPVSAQSTPAQRSYPGQVVAQRSVWYAPATTFAEGYLRGRADLTRATGEYNLNTSAAMINAQEAYRRAIDNKRHAAETYFEMRRSNQAFRDELRKPAPTPEQVARMAKAATPGRVDASQVNVTTGQIRWPGTLQEGQFDVFRPVVEAAFAERSLNNHGVGSRSHRTVSEVTRVMKQVLRADLNSYSPQEYTQAKKFLDKLAYEARFAPKADGLAVK